MNAAKIICFAATTSAAKAKQFYGDTLGLKLMEDNPFALVYDANGTMLRIQKVEAFSPARHTIVGWAVDNVQETIEKLTRKGVRFERYDGLRQDSTGVWTTPDGSRVAWFKDPDGNTLSLTEFSS